MSLTRGATSKFPCPVCLAGHHELCILTKTWPLRTSKKLYEIVCQARELPCAQDCEALLFEYSLHDIDVSVIIPVSYHLDRLTKIYRMYSGS